MTPSEKLAALERASGELDRIPTMLSAMQDEASARARASARVWRGVTLALVIAWLVMAVLGTRGMTLDDALRSLIPPPFPCEQAR